MNMQDLPDSNLDDLFRKAADSIEVEFIEESWDAMDKKLNDHMLTSKLIWGSVILILFFAIGFTFYSLKPGLIHRPQIRHVSPASPVNGPSQNIVAFNKHLEAENRSEMSQTDKNSNIQTEKRINPPSKIRMTYTKTSLSSSITQPPIDQGEKITEIRSRKPDLLGKMQELTCPKNTGSNLLTIPGVLNSLAGKSIKRNYISLNLYLGPEMSGVNFNETGFGSFRGIGIEYFTGNILSIATGLNYVTKKYSVSNGEYFLKDYTAPGYYSNPGDVQVSCEVIDIPLNFYFTLLNSGYSRLSIGGGSSSYIMLTELYSYGLNNHLSKTIKIKNENRNYFGVMNLSVAYSGRINQRFGWQIEPYYKLPLTKIAEAEVKLNTLGLNLVLKYRLK
jgi:hypothetical protein